MPAELRRDSPHRNRALTICAICIVAAIGVFAWVDHSRRILEAKKPAAFLARFRGSFNSGLIRLGEDSVIEEIHRRRMPEFGPLTFRGPGVKEYVVTAPFEQNGSTLWGRWLYTCNDAQGGGIFKFGYAEAATREGLPIFPAPGQRYIGWSDELVDGIPGGAGPTAAVISSPSQVRARSPCTLIASSDPGTVCRIQTFPPDALLNPSTNLEPDEKGKLQWTLNFNPKYVGGDIRVVVKCARPRGSRQLETSTDCPNVRILP